MEGMKRKNDNLLAAIPNSKVRSAPHCVYLESDSLLSKSREQAPWLQAVRALFEDVLKKTAKNGHIQFQIWNCWVMRSNSQYENLCPQITPIYADF